MKRTVTALGIWIVFHAAAQVAEGSGTVEPDSLTFGPVRIGTEVEDTVRVRNAGASDLLVESASFSDPAFDLPPEAFSGAPILLRPGGGMDIPIRFAPPDTAVFAGHLEVQTDGGVLRAELDGEGVQEAIVINEILADPPGDDAAGDANGDGTRDANEDEFIELLNISLRTIDVGGWQLSDEGTSEDKRFTFPEGTWIGPGERIVLFGGGVPGGIEGQVCVDDGKIGGGLRNSGDAVYLIDPAGPDTLARAEYGSEGGNDQSLVRDPEGRGAFVEHSLFPGNGTQFSPGRPRCTIQRLELEPSDTSVSVGDTMHFMATGVFSDGSEIGLVEEISWHTSDPAVLTVDGAMGQALMKGESNIWVMVGEIRSPNAHVVVTGPDIAELVSRRRRPLSLPETGQTTHSRRSMRTAAGACLAARSRGARRIRRWPDRWTMAAFGPWGRAR